MSKRYSFAVKNYTPTSRLVAEYAIKHYRGDVEFADFIVDVEYDHEATKRQLWVIGDFDKGKALYNLLKDSVKTKFAVGRFSVSWEKEVVLKFILPVMEGVRDNMLIADDERETEALLICEVIKVAISKLEEFGFQKSLF